MLPCTVFIFTAASFVLINGWMYRKPSVCWSLSLKLNATDCS